MAASWASALRPCVSDPHPRLAGVFPTTVRNHPPGEWGLSESPPLRDPPLAIRPANARRDACAIRGMDAKRAPSRAWATPPTRIHPVDDS
jgi:hypothetical protein